MILNLLVNSQVVRIISSFDEQQSLIIFSQGSILGVNPMDLSEYFVKTNLWTTNEIMTAEVSPEFDFLWIGGLARIDLGRVDLTKNMNNLKFHKKENRQTNYLEKFVNENIECIDDKIFDELRYLPVQNLRKKIIQKR